MVSICAASDGHLIVIREKLLFIYLIVCSSFDRTDWVKGRMSRALEHTTMLDAGSVAMKRILSRADGCSSLRHSGVFTS